MGAVDPVCSLVGQGFETMILVLLSAAYAEEAQADFSFTHILMNSGYVAWAVMITLTLMGLGSFISAIDRQIAFSRGRRQSMMLAAEIVGAMRQNDIAGAKKITQDERFKVAYLGSLLRAGLSEIEEHPDAFGIGAAHRAIGKAAVEEQAKLRRGFTLMATTASSAPFVGLFGTSVGVINAFQGMAGGSGGLAAVSTGISEALITTAYGIFIAVLAVWLYNYFNGLIEKVVEELTTSEADFLNWAEKLVHARSNLLPASGLSEKHPAAGR